MSEAAYTVSTVSRRVEQPKRAFVIDRPEKAYNLMNSVFIGAKEERFYGLYLDTRKQLLALELVSLGTVSTTIVHPREVFAPALERRATSLLVAHNHPSGNPEPSEDDIRLTRRLCQAGELLGIGLVDHLVIGAGVWYSFRETGLLAP